MSNFLRAVYIWRLAGVNFGPWLILDPQHPDLDTEISVNKPAVDDILISVQSIEVLLLSRILQQ